MNYDESLLQGAYANDNRPTIEPNIIFIVVSDNEVITFSSSDRLQAYEAFGSEIDFIKDQQETTKASFGWIYDYDFNTENNKYTLNNFTEEEFFILK